MASPKPLKLALSAAPSLQYIKSSGVCSPSTAPWVPGAGSDQLATTAAVADMLAKLERGGEAEVVRMAERLDGWTQVSSDGDETQ